MDAAVRARWGDLFLETHQNNEAAKLFEESLMLDEHYAPAMLGLASVAAGRFEEKGRDLANEVIEKSPDSSVEAYLLLARADLEDGALAEADAKLDKARAIAQKQKLPELEIDALKASADLLRGKTDSEWTARALKANPGYGDAYAIPAYFYVITRRYREAIELYQKAVDIEPGLYSAHAELGVNLLRENRVDEAREHLTVAYRGDPFSAPIVNTLRLIDSFQNFVVEKHLPDPSAATEATPGADKPAKNPGALLRLHKNEAAVLDAYVLDLVNRTIQEYSKRYAFELKEPVVVELYPEHDDFAVRTSGLPGIGLLGVTFGYLVAMDSPTGRSDSDFHWGTTLWHEMAHVFTLEKTKHLVPRWFSEGVSVYEEWTTGPLPGRHIPLTVFKAIKEDKFLAHRGARSRLHSADVRGAGDRVVHAGRPDLRVHRVALGAAGLALDARPVRRGQGHSGGAAGRARNRAEAVRRGFRAATCRASSATRSRTWRSGRRPPRKRSRRSSTRTGRAPRRPRRARSSFCPSMSTRTART